MSPECVPGHVYGYIKIFFKNTTQRSAPRLSSHGWHGMWENMGSFPSPMVRNFMPEQLQDPDEVTEYLKAKVCGYSKEAKLITLCCDLASIYQTLFNIMQRPQREEREKRLTGTAATPTLVPSPAATLTHCGYSNTGDRHCS